MTTHYSYCIDHRKSIAYVHGDENSSAKSPAQHGMKW